MDPGTLHTILSELAALRDDVQHLSRRILAADDRRELALLLPAAWGVMGNTTWTANDLARRAVLATGLHGAALLEVLDQNNSTSGGLRAFGRLLARIEGVACAGLRLERQGVDGNRAALYVVRSVSGFQASETGTASGAEPSDCPD